MSLIRRFFGQTVPSKPISDSIISAFITDKRHLFKTGGVLSLILSK